MGVISTLVFLTIALSLILYSEILREHQGVVAFLSLLILILVFVGDKWWDRERRRKQKINALLALSRQTDYLKRNLKYVKGAIPKRIMPVHILSLYNISWEHFPISVDGKSTRDLYELATFIDDKIRTLNERRAEILQIVLTYDTVERKEAMVEKYYKSFGEAITEALEGLVDGLNAITTIFYRWGIYPLDGSTRLTKLLK